MRHSQGFGEQGKMAFISGEQRKKYQILRGTETISGNREYIYENKILGNRGTNQLISEEKGNMYPPPPLRGLRISLRRQNTTKEMAYNITRNWPL